MGRKVEAYLYSWGLTFRYRGNNPVYTDSGQSIEFALLSRVFGMTIFGNIFTSATRGNLTRDFNPRSLTFKASMPVATSTSLPLASKVHKYLRLSLPLARGDPVDLRLVAVRTRSVHPISKISLTSGHHLVNQ